MPSVGIVGMLGSGHNAPRSIQRRRSSLLVGGSGASKGIAPDLTRLYIKLDRASPGTRAGPDSPPSSAESRLMSRKSPLDSSELWQLWQCSSIREMAWVSRPWVPGIWRRSGSWISSSKARYIYHQFRVQILYAVAERSYEHPSIAAAEKMQSNLISPFRELFANDQLFLVTRSPRLRWILSKLSPEMT